MDKLRDYTKAIWYLIAIAVPSAAITGGILWIGYNSGKGVCLLNTLIN